MFTDEALAGNQLAVVLDAKGLSGRLMQRIAREMNFSETTFVLPADDSSHAARVRIFTPGTELQFAGHPTIGTAWVLLKEGVGPVPVRRDGEMLWMTHPRVEFKDVFPHAGVAEAIGLETSAVVPDVPAQVVSTGTPFLFVLLKERRTVDDAVPDRSRIARLLDGGGAHGVFLFAVNGPKRLYSRMFATDIAEDPATGSASGPLGAFAVRYGVVPRASRLSIVSEQGVKMGRRSVVHIALEYGDDDSDSPTLIEVGGSVMPVLSGDLSEFAP